MADSRPVLLIGLDAADSLLVEELVDAGAMPNLAHLRRAGTRGELVSRPEGLSAMRWSKFFEGGRIARYYFPKAWNPDAMRLDWTPQATGDPRPFWHHLADAGCRVAVIDVPHAPLRQPGPDGLHIQGWQLHDLIERGSAPTDLWTRLAAEVGAPPMGHERYGRQTASMLQELHRAMLASLEQSTRLCTRLLAQGPWDLFLVVLGATHRAGHYLWDLSQIDASSLGRDDRIALEGALRDIYGAADRLIGEVAEAAPAEARLVVMSLHGMGPNPGWSERAQQIDARMAGARGTGRTTLLGHLKASLPSELIQDMWGLLPGPARDRLVPLLSARTRHWPSTSHFALPSDVFGLIRVNLEGREAAGIVPQGTAYAALLDEVAETWRGIRDLDHGRSIVRAIERIDDHVATDHPARRWLPDMAILWSDVRASETSGVELAGGGPLRWPRDRALPSGRSGNHRGWGWFVATGADIPADRVLETECEVADLPATVLDWLGVERPRGFGGSVMPMLAGRRA